MTTTNFTVGVSTGDKITSKVLKPPGGETHDIFGTTTNGTANGTPRKMHQSHLESNVFNSHYTDHCPAAQQQTPQQKYGNGRGASNIFGDGEEDKDEQTPRKIKDYNKSSVFAEPEPYQENVAPRRTILQPEVKKSQDVAAAGQYGQPFYKQGGGNPITGEGYTPNGSGTSNGEPKENGAVNRKVPPGGYSSKLW